MPIYCYQVIHEDGTEGETFEHMQPISAAPLTHHPETGEPVRRMVSRVNISGPYSDAATNSMLKDNKKLESLGFTKYERRGKGVMERTAGTQGPKMLGGD